MNFLAVSGWVMTVAFGIYELWRARKERTFNINRVILACRNLHKRMLSAGFYPEVIIVPGEKNALIAHFLKEFMADSPLVIVSTQVYRTQHELEFQSDSLLEIKTTRSSLFFQSDLRDIVGRKILFLDSIKKSGTTMNAVTDYLQSIGVATSELRTCCLIDSKNYPHAPEPDFFFAKMSGKVSFPWQTVHVS